MGILTIVLVARIAARLAAVDVPIPLSFATTSFVLGVLIAICAVLKLLTDDYRNFWAFIGVGPRDRRRHRRVARGAGSRRNRVAQERREQSSIERLRDGCPRRSGRRTLDPGSGSAGAPEMPAAADTGHDAGETAASEAPDMASEAAGAPSDAADAASDATSDEPSTERES